jgi:hypothetical protein
MTNFGAKRADTMMLTPFELPHSNAKGIPPVFNEVFIFVSSIFISLFASSLYSLILFLFILVPHPSSISLFPRPDVNKPVE